MKKLVTAAIVVAFAAPALAQGDSDVRLAKLQEIVVTADKAQPANYTPDAKTAALLAEIQKTK